MRSLSLAKRSFSIRRPTSPDRSTTPKDVSKPNFGPNTKGEKPHEFQKEGILWMAPQKNCLLGDDMGVGKSCQALRALPRRPRCIIGGPASLGGSWKHQVSLWRPDLHITFDKELRRPDENEILYISYDSLPDLSDWTTRLVEQPMRDVYLIYDECQMLMTDDAQRTQKARRLRVQCRSCWGLSATPMLGDPEDLWGVLMSLGLTHIFNNSKPEFVELCGGSPRYVWDKHMNRGRGGRRRVGFNWGEVSPEVKERLKTVMLRRLADDVLDELPEKQFIDVLVDAPEDLREHLNPQLDRIKKEWDEIGPNDLPPLPLFSEASTALARAKIPAALEFADSHATSEQPLLVFSAHVAPVAAVGGLKDAAVITGEDSGPKALRKRHKIVDDFQAGKYRILAITIKTGGAGLNLQRAANVLFVDRAYTPSANAQAYARARRQGNKRERVICWSLITDHPLDRHLTDVLVRKERLITAAVG